MESRTCQCCFLKRCNPITARIVNKLLKKKGGLLVIQERYIFTSALPKQRSQLIIEVIWFFRNRVPHEGALSRTTKSQFILSGWRKCLNDNSAVDVTIPEGEKEEGKNVLIRKLEKRSSMFSHVLNICFVWSPAALILCKRAGICYVDCYSAQQKRTACTKRG